MNIKHTTLKLLCKAYIAVIFTMMMNRGDLLNTERIKNLDSIRVDLHRALEKLLNTTKLNKILHRLTNEIGLPYPEHAVYNEYLLENYNAMIDKYGWRLYDILKGYLDEEK